MSVSGAQLLATDCIWGSPGPLGEQASSRLGEFVLRSGGASGGGSEPSWAEGGGSDPPKCGVGRKGEMRSRPIPSGIWGAGADLGRADPGASRAESEPAPAPSL